MKVCAARVGTVDGHGASSEDGAASGAWWRDEDKGREGALGESRTGWAWRAEMPARRCGRKVSPAPAFRGAFPRAFARPDMSLFAHSFERTVAQKAQCSFPCTRQNHAREVAPRTGRRAVEVRGGKGRELMLKGAQR